MTSQALQQGGMGLILTTLILTAPPMAAMFFQGTLGSFTAYSQIGGVGGAQPGHQGQSPGSYAPAQSPNAGSSNHAGPVANSQDTTPRSLGSASGANPTETGKKGIAAT
jgi:type IV secretion system protein VirB6